MKKTAASQPFPEPDPSDPSGATPARDVIHPNPLTKRTEADDNISGLRGAAAGEESSRDTDHPSDHYATD